MYKKYLWGLFVCILLYSCFKETIVEVKCDFEVEVVNNDYSVPVTLRVLNKTVGADLYEWTFEGGELQRSNSFNPEEIVYQEAGTYTIRLEAWNTTQQDVKEVNVELSAGCFVW